MSRFLCVINLSLQNTNEYSNITRMQTQQKQLSDDRQWRDKKLLVAHPSYKQPVKVPNNLLIIRNIEYEFLLQTFQFVSRGVLRMRKSGQRNVVGFRVVLVVRNALASLVCMLC